MFTTKLLLLALGCASGLFVGIFFSNELKKKKCFYEELAIFIDEILGDLGFRQNGIRTVALNYANESKSYLKNVLEEYAANPNVVPAFLFLSGNERVTVKDFFSNLGKTDIVTQRSELENIKPKIQELRNTYKTKHEKKGAMYIKLGLLVGLAVGILLL